MISAHARHPELAEFLLKNAIRFGEFRLASGATSTYYCDGKQASFSARGSLLIADAVLNEIRGLEVAAVGGMDMGATPIVSAGAPRSGQAGGPPPAVLVSNDGKAHRALKKSEGWVAQAPGAAGAVGDAV